MHRRVPELWEGKVGDILSSKAMLVTHNRRHAEYLDTSQSHMGLDVWATPVSLGRRMSSNRCSGSLVQG